MDEDATLISKLRNELEAAEKALDDLRRLNSKVERANAIVAGLDDDPVMKKTELENRQMLTLERTSFIKMRGFKHEIEEKIEILKNAITRIPQRSTTSTPPW
jgi:hypothetical protein